MSATQLEFPEWWQDFLRKGHQREDYHETLDRLFRFVDQLPPTKRDAFASELTDLACQQGNAWHVALGALERLAGPTALARLASIAIALPAVHPPHPLADYRVAVLRVLARDPSGKFLDAVDAYCSGEVDAWFTSVAWALWPHHKERSSRCHARYFAEKPRTEWSGTLVVDAFIKKPEALRLVRDRLLDQDPAIWDAVCADVLAACSKFPVGDEQVIETRRACGIEAA